MKFELKKQDVISVLMVLVSAFIYACGINTFVKPGNLFPGGFSGLSRLLSQALGDFAGVHISFSVFYLSLNVIVTLLVRKRLGHHFIVLSILHYTLASVFTSLIPVRAITVDPLLISVFGGLVNGFAVGLALRYNASSGGTDFISVYFSMVYNIPMWNYVLGFNALVLVIAGVLYGWNQAMYSIIFQFISTQVVSTLHERFKTTEINVVTNMPDTVCDAVFHRVRHGITKVPCEGGFTGQPHWMLIIAVNKYQTREVVNTIREADPHAFVTIHSVERIVGNYYQKPLE